MAFTGRLGTTDSQLGSIVLGSVASGRSFTLSAVITAEQEATLTLDAVVFKEQAGSLTLDAVVFKEQAGSFGLDAVLFAEYALFELDAVILAEQSGTAGLYACVLAVQSGAFSLDAILQTVQTSSAALDAWIRATQTGSFALDAVIGNDISVLGSFGLDAVMLGTGGYHSRLTSHMGTQPDSVITALGLTGYADGTLLPDVLADLFGRATNLPYGFFLGATIQGPTAVSQAGSFAFDARIAYGAQATLDAIIENTEELSFGLDAFVLTTVVQGNGNVPLSAIIKGPRTFSRLFAAVLANRTFTLAAVVRREQQATRTLASIIKAEQTGSVGLDAEIV